MMEYKNVAIGSDHGGFDAKEGVKKHLKDLGIEVIDEGTFSKDSCDYPIFAKKVAEDVKDNKVDFGILICTSGEGMIISANKVKGVRAGLLYNEEVAGLVKKHNNVNVIAFGAKYFSILEINKMVDIYMSSEFEGGRHSRRVDEMMDIEK